MGSEEYETRSHHGESNDTEGMADAWHIQYSSDNHKSSREERAENRAAEDRRQDYLDRCDNRTKWENKHHNTNYPKDSRYW